MLQQYILQRRTLMSNKAPVFPIPEPQHFSDYGFDPQIDYFQVLEEARNYKRENVTSIDTQHFKLQKPISTDEHSPKKNKMRWWRNALLFFNLNKWVPRGGGSTTASGGCNNINHQGRHRVGSLFMIETLD
ncbi:unnamed protein product [Fraxinus pennsylvanica]|uniref:Uncharacterized protein n=1 Tax=Fraxinus pennsylvanica TaxID=56036 RepID=A0AAD1Z4G6_9LAMI|nr:unnamed protein product [Fraxinus pennsylvanica]